jgi:putative aldouronate transport system permease protein
VKQARQKVKTVEQVTRLPARRSAWSVIWKYKTFYLMILPLLVFMLIFCYLPMGGLVMAFQDFRPARGIFRSEFVGFENFIEVFTDKMFWERLRNTVCISVLKIIFTAPAPIILAMLINEVRNKSFKKAVQTIVYLPRFISWVVVATIVAALLDVQGGPVNTLLMRMGLLDEPMLFMGNKTLFWPLLVLTEIWKGVGWSSIIYLAALTSISPEYYEAATIDGANRLQKMWYITWPFLKPTFIILVILSMGSILSAGFDQVFVMANNAVMDVGDIIDTYVYRTGLASRRYGYAAAVGLFKSVVSLVLILGANTLARKTDNESLF